MIQPTTPLEILLAAMHRKWEEGDLDAAAALARAAAPYIHPRRAVLRDVPQTGLHQLTDAQLRALADPDAGTVSCRDESAPLGRGGIGGNTAP